MTPKGGRSARNHAYYDRHGEAVRIRNDTPERKARRKEYMKEYYQKNRDAINAIQARYEAGHAAERKQYRHNYYKRNRERIAASQKVYQAAHRDEKNARARARRAEKHQGQVRLGKVYVDRDMLMDIVSVGNHDNR